MDIFVAIDGRQSNDDIKAFIKQRMEQQGHDR